MPRAFRSAARHVFSFVSVLSALSICFPVSAQTPATLTARAVAAMAAADFDAAVTAADSALALAPDLSAVQLVVGQAYLSHARENPSIGAIGKVKKGRAAVERAIALDPDNLDARSTLMQFLLQAPGIVGGSRDGAREQAVEIERRDRERGLLARLEVATVGGKRDEILAVYDEALPLLGTPADTGSVLAQALLAAAKRLRNKDLREALTARVYAAVPDEPAPMP
jgi:tetratricopeptide (TPR) repeat protein